MESHPLCKMPSNPTLLILAYNVVRRHGAHHLLSQGSSTLLIAAEKLALPRLATWRLSLESIAFFFEYAAAYFRQESHNTA